MDGEGRPHGAKHDEPDEISAVRRLLFLLLHADHDVEFTEFSPLHHVSLLTYLIKPNSQFARHLEAIIE